MSSNGAVLPRRLPGVQQTNQGTNACIYKPQCIAHTRVGWVRIVPAQGPGAVIHVLGDAGAAVTDKSANMSYAVFTLECGSKSLQNK